MRKIVIKSFYWILLLVLAFSCSTSLPEAVEAEMTQLPETIDFNFHIRPILSDRCWSCHGPDEEARQAGLRLDTEEGAFQALAESGNRAFVAGNLSKSTAVQRMIHTDPALHMPPPESNLSLTNREIAIVAKWVEQGATWKKHWSFIPPTAVSPPSISNSDAIIKNEIDQFILAKLEEEDLEASPAADKERLLRRVYLDLTGLPPTIEAMDAFLADQSDNAYEKVVEDLLNSDACAERLAMEWMDVARYADSHGLHADGWRLMWPWRDWVINAFKENKPYDEFVIEQLAGDLLPNPSTEQKLATAFNRNHPMTAEGGAIDEEFRLSYVFDRAETAATAFLGLTLNCARCHDHKFDPISQEEYYQMATFFNNVKELGMTGDDGNYGPMMLLLSEQERSKMEAFQKTIKANEDKLQLTKEEITSTETFVNQLSAINQPRKAVVHLPLDSKKEQTIKGRTNYRFDNNPNAIASEDIPLVAGQKGKAALLEGDYTQIYLNEVGLFEVYDPYSASIWFNAEEREAGKTQVLMGTAGDKNNFWRGWDFFIDTTDRLSVRLIHSLPHNYIQITTQEQVAHNEWVHAAFTYDGSAKASGLKLYINGAKAPSTVNYDRLYKTIKTVGSGAHVPTNRPIRVGKSYRSFTGENGILKGKVDDIYIYKTKLSAAEVALIAGKSENKDRQLLVEYYLDQNAKVKGLERDLRLKRKEWLEFMNPLSEVMIMEETPEARPMFVLTRGQYDMPEQEVTAATPDWILPFPEQLPQNRLGFAKWLFEDGNPLTARVTVNRYWQLFFGTGLVKTTNDFGSQGALPSHPELLDWLALELQNSDWDLKHLLKLIVTSATYRQSSKATAIHKERDPLNRYLARGPSFRLPAEMIRDNALAASGLLVEQLGGESVKPYQPDGLWIDKGSFSHKLLRYKASRGDSLYRRSMYTFIRRTSPPPAMTAFDLPSRDVCNVQRESTNTPLQALVLLNDPQFVEAAKVLAQRMQQEGGTDLNSQIAYAFRLSTGRKPNSQELEIFKGLFEKEANKFQQKPGAAKEFLAVGEYKLDPKLNTSKTAALAIVASTMLNHDEAYTKR